MLSLDDPRWNTMTAGYRVPFDPRNLLKRLESDQEVSGVWMELWNELHHQGDVGEASFAAVPYLVDICQRCRIADWNTYAIVAIIELARKEGKNPDVPEWLSEDYLQAIRELAQLGALEIQCTSDPDTPRAILSIMALAKGLRAHAKFLINYSEDEMLDIESRI